MTYPSPLAPPDAFAERGRALLREQLQRLGRVCPPVHIGDVGHGQAVPLTRVHTWSSSYTTGGEDLVTSDIPGLIATFWPTDYASGSVYTFSHDTGSNKLLAYADGVEVAAATNLNSLLGTTRYVAFGSEATERVLYYAKEDARLFSVFVQLAAAFTANASKYWTLSVVHRSGSTARTLATFPLNAAANNLAAYTPRAIFESALPDGVLVEAGDTVALRIEETGVATGLSGLTAWADVRRKVT